VGFQTHRLKAKTLPLVATFLHPMVDSFRAQNLRGVSYHSIIDCIIRDFVIDDMHSMRNHPDRANSMKRDIRKSTPNTCTPGARTLT